jgi:serine phosphatase RsbU (regulator of sigma subunit)
LLVCGKKRNFAAEDVIKMKKNSKKSIINRARAGIVLIVIAAALAQVINIVQYVYTRKAIKEQTFQKTYQDMKEIQRVMNLKTTVETAVQNAMGDVLMNLKEPEMFYGIASRLVSRNDHIVGSAVAMRPGYFPQKDKLYAPFAYPESKGGQPRTKLLPYDYTEQEWYSKPFKADSAMWSEPYTDVGGSGLLIYTYSQPIHDKKGSTIGILTADVHFKELAMNNITYDEIDRVNLWGFILQLIGLLLVIFIVWRYAKKFREVNHLIMTQQLISKELQIAGDIHTAMLPKVSDKENKLHHVDIKAKILAAPDVSADFYDYLYVGQTVVFCIGDVPGSNVKASLMMSITRSAFRTAVSMNSHVQEPSPAAIVSAMNKALCSINHNEMFTTLFLGVLNLETTSLTYCCAGNPAPVMMDPVTGATQLDTLPNIPLGIMNDFEFQEQKIILIDEFTLFLFNDGIYELENKYHEMFGQKRMMTRLENSVHAGDNPEKILSKMQEALESFRGSATQTDDVTMIALRII